MQLSRTGRALYLQNKYCEIVDDVHQYSNSQLYNSPLYLYALCDFNSNDFCKLLLIWFYLVY